MANLGYQTSWRLRNLEHRRAYERKWKREERIRKLQMNPIKFLEAERKRGQSKYRRLRLAVLLTLGHRCNCCGQEEEKFLALDHVQNDGKEHRARRTGQGIYRDALREGLPPERYQLLCHNCNMAKQYYGECPHKTEVKRPEDNDTRWLAAEVERLSAIVAHYVELSE